MWIKSSVSSISELEIEKATIDAIDILVSQKEKATQKALEDYIVNYPNGLDQKNVLPAREILYSNEKWTSD